MFMVMVLVIVLKSTKKANDNLHTAIATDSATSNDSFLVTNTDTSTDMALIQILKLMVILIFAGAAIEIVLRVVIWNETDQVDRIIARQQAKQDRRIASLRKLGDYMDFDSGS